MTSLVVMLIMVLLSEFYQPHATKAFRPLLPYPARDSLLSQKPRLLLSLFSTHPQRKLIETPILDCWKQADRRVGPHNMTPAVKAAAAAADDDDDEFKNFQSINANESHKARFIISQQQISIFVATMTIFIATTLFGLSTMVPVVHATDSFLTTSLTVTTLPTESTILLATQSTQQQQQQQQQQKEEWLKEQQSIIEEVWSLINKYYIDPTFNQQDWNTVKEQAIQDIQKTKFLDNDATMKIVTQMVQSLGDKYSRILDVQQYSAIQKFDLIGVGVTLMPNSQKKIIVGAPPIAGSASAKAGLQVGDYVTKVNGVPTLGRNAFDIIDQISASPNAKTVTFTILRKPTKAMSNNLDSVSKDDNNHDMDETLLFDVTMERQTMQVKDPIQYKISEQRPDGTKVGYIRLSEFNSLANASLQKAVQDLSQQGANAYVLDLRANTGGAFQSAVEIAGMFVKDRVATYVVDRNRAELPFRTPKLQPLIVDPTTPIVIWLDGMSASASEVLAGSLHDNCRAVTMGENSFGKGLIQAVYGLKNGAGLVLTVARYVTPSGYEIQGKGIVPDISGSMPAPFFIPGLSSDTSKVDFQEVKKRLDSEFCKVPAERSSPLQPSAESLVNTT